MVLLTLSISIYQSFIFVFISLTIVHIVACLYIDKSKYIRYEIYSSICISILSCILYLSITAVTIGIHVGYTKNFVHWSFNMSNNIDVFKTTLYLLKEYISGSNFYGGSLYVLSIPATIALLLKLYSKKEKNILLYLFVICLPCIPFLQMFIFGGFQPARVFLAQGIILSFLLSYVLIEYNVHTFIIKITTIFILFISSFYITHLFELDVNQLNRDKELAKNIISQLNKNISNIKNEKILIFGAPERHLLKDNRNYEIFGSSFFCFDGGNVYRQLAFIRYYNLGEYLLPSREEALALTQRIEHLPKWPHPGCIAKIDGIWVVRLGDSLGFI